ncbi:hypothetical protein [Mesorhizobium sp. M1B.F.Ca.ET.045.04.1.1]|uniref:hypothetical protein n=1 Tax=Mesorhizobium sp. M1B.F.Ca.ET.045.04.1.1 TaxID=2493673 RepID=UPI001FE1A9FC|nr:hypothetical protein [Mesorhizobium sp. M1B.F.Ca.ET.045.04.1.1]
MLYLGLASGEVGAGVEEAAHRAAGGAAPLSFDALDRAELAPQLGKFRIGRAAPAGKHLAFERAANVSVGNCCQCQQRSNSQERDLEEPQTHHWLPPF